MKGGGGRLHRPEPPSGALPTTTTATAAPADDWVDGSWTVDCSCGVTFDDGEEMVSCDDCNVWVHTRCARYLRGVHASFSCHNCKAKRAPSSAADEAEVAELLAELPTHRPPPPHRRWSEVPLPARVHVHGVPGGGGDAALFRGAPASFSAALWRSAGYVPKRFGFRYSEFPYWADDKDGADALFAFAREKRKEIPLPLRLQKVEKNCVPTLRESAKNGDDDASDLGEAHKIGAYIRAAAAVGADTSEDGFQQNRDLAMLKDHSADAETNMASSDFHVLVEANKKTEESLQQSGDSKCSREIPGTLNKDEPKGSVKLEIPSRIGTSSAVAEQEVHSRFVQVSNCKQQSEGHRNVGLQSGTLNAVLKMEDSKPSNGDMQIDAGSEKMHEGLEKQSDVKVVVGVLNLQSSQSELLNIESDAATNDHDGTNTIQDACDEHKSNKQGGRDTACSSIFQRHSDSQHRKSETLPEHPKSISGVPKVCQASSGSISNLFELSGSLLSTEPSSARNTAPLIRKEQTRLVSPVDSKQSKHDSEKHSEGSSQEFTMYSEKVQLKGFIPCASKSSQASRTYVSSAKHRLPVPKEQTQKSGTTGGTPARSLQGEEAPLHSRNKLIPSSLHHKNDKIHHRFIHTTQEDCNNPTSTELQATDVTASLSDQQLALLLHQQLNSSPRVPRVPRGHQAASMQMPHSTGGQFFSKRSSAHGGKDQMPALKKRNRGDPWRDNDDMKRTRKVPIVERRHRDCSTERTISLKDSCRLAENIELEQKNHGICTSGATTGLEKDDPMDSSVSHNVPGLIDEIISKNINITYGKLCDAVRQHFGDLSKPNGEDYAYPSYLHAVNDCLRNRSDWAHLVDQAPMMNLRKRRKVEESDSVLAVSERDMRNRAERGVDDEGGAGSHQEDLARGKQNAHKRKQLELKGRSIKDTRKRSSIVSSDDDDGDDATFSDSGSDINDTPMDESQGNFVAPETAGYMEPKSAD